MSLSPSGSQLLTAGRDAYSPPDRAATEDLLSRAVERLHINSTTLLARNSGQWLQVERLPGLETIAALSDMRALEVAVLGASRPADGNLMPLRNVRSVHLWDRYPEKALHAFARVFTGEVLKTLGRDIVGNEQLAAAIDPSGSIQYLYSP